MSAAPAESMEPPVEDVGARGRVRGCSHPDVDLHGRDRRVPDGYLRWCAFSVGRAPRAQRTVGSRDIEVMDSESVRVQEKRFE